MDKEIKSWAFIIIISILIGILILNFFSFYAVSGYSMLPTMEENEYLLIKKYKKNHLYAKGDIIVFKTELVDENGQFKSLIKRVIAVEGENVTIVENRVYIEGVEFKESYLYKNETSGNMSVEVLDGSIFVMGDNRDISLDSRKPQIGLVSETQVIGKAIFKLFPFESIGDDKNEKN